MKTTTYIATKDGVTCTVSDQPEPTKASILRANLTLAVTAYDHMIRTRAARNPRVYHNPFALSLYLDAIERVIEDAETMPMRAAISLNFTGRMLNNLLRKAAR
jgi:hypothetical protein